MSQVQSNYIITNKTKPADIEKALKERLADSLDSQLNNMVCLTRESDQRYTGCEAETFEAHDQHVYAAISKEGHILYRRRLTDASLKDGSVYFEMSRLIHTILQDSASVPDIKAELFLVGKAADPVSKAVFPARSRTKGGRARIRRAVAEFAARAEVGIMLHKADEPYAEYLLRLTCTDRSPGLCLISVRPESFWCRQLPDDAQVPVKTDLSQLELALRNLVDNYINLVNQ